MTGQDGHVSRTGETRQPAGRQDDSQVSPQPPAESDDTAAAIADLQRRIELLDGEWRRALADADNLRKRFARDIERVRAQERAEAARAWLAVVDNLDRAVEHAQADPQAIIEGVRAIRDQADKTMADLGFARRDDTGQPFDPARHEAVGARSGTGAQPGTVVQVLRPAYGTGERQLRPAQVLVAKED